MSLEDQPSTRRQKSVTGLNAVSQVISERSTDEQFAVRSTGHHDSRRKFLRVVGFLWVAVVFVTFIGALIAPHLGRMADFVLHQTAQRDWTHLTLRTARPFFDLSVPEHTIKSYYSALYRGDAAAMERLTAGSFREQMQRRVAEAEPGHVVYRSYLRTERAETHDAVVVEKFHLFWQRGLRFNLRRNAAGWRIAGVDLVR